MTSYAMRDLEVQIANTRSAATEQWFHAKLNRGFVVSEEFTNASTGDTADLALSNPADSGQTIIVSGVVGNSSAKSFVRVYDEFDSNPTGSGTEVDASNDILDKAGNGEPAVAIPERDLTYTATDTHGAYIIGGTSSGQGSASGLGTFLPILIEPGRTIVVELEKLESGGDEVIISCDFFEVPQVFSEENARFDPLEAYQ